MVNISSGDMDPTVAVIFEPMRSTMLSPNSRFISGMMMNHTKNEPQHIINEYFSPMIYPSPSTAAPTLTLKRSLALVATCSPQGSTLDVNTSDHHPKVETMKS